VKRAGEIGGGFGLFSIQERLELPGGGMHIDSAPGRGSRFTLAVGAVRAAVADATDVPAHARSALDTPAAPIESPSGGPSFRVLLADDHALVREGPRRPLSGEPDIEIVGEAGDGQEAIELAARLRPDVIVMDVSMPRVDGVAAARASHRDQPDIRIFGLSMFEDGPDAEDMRNAGADGYFTKSGPPGDLIAAIRRACGSPR
jgi:CheY-like chemotaxis protein